MSGLNPDQTSNQRNSFHPHFLNQLSQTPNLFSNYSPPDHFSNPHLIYPYSNDTPNYSQNDLHQNSTHSFLLPFPSGDQSNSSLPCKDNTQQHQHPSDLSSNQVNHLNQKVKRNSLNHQKIHSKKKSNQFWNLFGYRQLGIIGLIALCLITSAIVIIVVTHIKKSTNHNDNPDPDDTNDITSQSGLGSARNTTDGLDPFNRTNTNTQNDFPPDNGQRGGASGYDSLIVFGASYCDNAHARPSKLRNSLKPAPYFKGRWTNGYVWDEYLAAIIGPNGRRTTLVNYAFGGATVDNTLNEAPVPDLEQQINAFLSDLGAQSPGAGPPDGKSLIGIWIGINSVTKMWNAVLKQQAQARSQAGVQEIMAQAQININTTVDKMFSLIANLIQASPFKNAPPDLLILSIPPAELLLVNIKAAKGNVGSLRTLEVLGEMFNNRFNAQFNTLQETLLKRSSSSTSNNSQQRLFTLDIPNIWRKLIDEPNSANLTVVDRPCLTKLGTCNQPESFLFWDTLHPTTHVHKQLALMMNQEING